MAGSHPDPSMALRLETRSMDKPDDTKSPPRAKVETIRMQGRTFTRFTFMPGFRWSTDIGPAMKADVCPMNHVMYQVSGELRVRMKDGSEATLRPGEAQVLPAGHDVWVVGDKPWVAVSID